MPRVDSVTEPGKSRSCFARLRSWAVAHGSCSNSVELLMASYRACRSGWIGAHPWFLEQMSAALLSGTALVSTASFGRAWCRGDGGSWRAVGSGQRAVGVAVCIGHSQKLCSGRANAAYVICTPPSAGVWSDSPDPNQRLPTASQKSKNAKKPAPMPFLPARPAVHFRPRALPHPSAALLDEHAHTPVAVAVAVSVCARAPPPALPPPAPPLVPARRNWLVSSRTKRRRGFRPRSSRRIGRRSPSRRPAGDLRRAHRSLPHPPPDQATLQNVL